MTKICTKCKEVRRLDQFTKDKAGKDGLHSQCKICRSIARKIYRAANLDAERARTVAWHVANPGRNRTNSADYRSRNLAKETARLGKLRLTRLGQAPEVSAIENWMIGAMYTMSIILSKSTGERYEVDHIHPVSKGGLHTFENLQILSKADNRAKGVSQQNQ